jgi:hypothetical protein
VHWQFYVAARLFASSNDGAEQGFRLNARKENTLFKVTSVLLILVMATTSSMALAAEQRLQQSVSEMRAVAQKAVERNKAVDVVLRVKRDGKKKLSGMPSNVSDQGFSLIDRKSSQESHLDFEEIREVRLKPSHVWLGVGIAIGAGVAIAVLLALNSALNKS